MKTLIRSFTLFLAFCIALLIVAFYDNQEVTIQSDESKTFNGNPVFNKIKYFRFNDKDVWMMNQSHHGKNAAKMNWDRLAIVVKSTEGLKTAQFYQLEPGPLQWSDDLKPIANKVACYICHANGPRFIRPNFKSVFNESSLWERLKITAWNFKIKSYGRVSLDQEQGDMKGLKFQGPYANEELKVATCVLCHKEQGFLARGKLLRQHTPTMKYMLESGSMPPVAFRLSSAEKDELEKFILGF